MPGRRFWLLAPAAAIAPPVREKRAKIIAAEGEFQAAEKLTGAAHVMSAEPGAMALRYMQTLLDMGAEKNSTIVFPIPLELIRPLPGDGPRQHDRDRRPVRAVAETP
jgi:hypothetical protein